MQLLLAFRFHGLRPDSPRENALETCLRWVEEHEATLHLAAESHWLRDWEHDPSSRARARHLFGAERLIPILTHSEGAHVAFLSATELADELGNNQRKVGALFQLPDDTRLGLWGSAWGIDLGKLADESVAWVIVPTPSPSSRASGSWVEQHTSFPLLPVRTVYQDRMAGWVAEVGAGRCSPDEAGRNFAWSLKADASALDPHRPIPVFLDVGHAEISWVTQILSGTLGYLQEQGEVSFVSVAELPSEDPEDFPPDRAIFGYYPEETDLVRTDGFYAAYLEVAPVPAPYQPQSLAARRPLILWEEGRFLVQLIEFFYDGFDFPKVSADYPDFPHSDPAFLLRRLKHASYWGPRPLTEDRNAALIPLGLIIALFREALKKGPIRPSATVLPEEVIRGLRAVLRFQVDNPVTAYDHYWRAAGSRREHATLAADLREVREHRQRASEGISRMDSAIAALPISRGAWYRAVDMLDVYTRELGAALDALERCRGLDAEPDAFYRSLIPPQLPLILDRLESNGHSSRRHEYPGPERLGPGEVPGEMHSW